METRDADLLLHIADGANPDCGKQIAVVNGVLKNIGAGQIPQILVYNKTDKMDTDAERRDKNAVYISALKNQGIDILKQKIAEMI
jgi:GTP-binding protein HflX